MHRFVLLLAAFALCACGVEAASPVQTSGKWRTLDGKPPLVIAHRGASGYRPEHTIASYTLAIEQGADYIEPDLVATRDGHLVARHEPMLDDTTDVKSRPQFADRRTTKMLDGKSVTAFFASDFTLAEIKQLRAVQSNPARSKEYDGRFEIPTFEEILDLAERESARRGRTIGIYPETKHPSFHIELNLPLEDRLLAALGKRKLDRPDGPVFIQSFESANLQYLRTKTRLPLVQLMEEGELLLDASGKRIVGVNVRQFDDKRGGAAAENSGRRGEVCERHRPVEAIDHARRRRTAVAADHADRAGARCRTARARVHIPHRARDARAGVPRRSETRVPSVLRARHRRCVLGFPGRRAQARRTTSQMISRHSCGHCSTQQHT